MAVLSRILLAVAFDLEITDDEATLDWMDYDRERIDNELAQKVLALARAKLR